MAIKAILFDFYGTLIERQKKQFIKLISHNHLQRLKTEERPLSLAALLLDVQQKLMTCDLTTHSIPHEILSLVSPEPYHDSVDIERRLRNAMRQEADSTRLFPGVKNLLAFFKRQGYHLGVVSNVSSYHKAPFYRFGLDKLIDVAVFSCDIGSIKPQEDIYLSACRQLGVLPEDVLFVGDSYKSDVLAPRSLGMQALHIAHFKKTPHNVEHISELGLILFNGGVTHLKHHINNMPELSKRRIFLQYFTLSDIQNPCDDLIYHCTGTQAGKKQKFYLQRSALTPATSEQLAGSGTPKSDQQEFPLALRIASEVFTLNSSNPQEDQD